MAASATTTFQRFFEIPGYARSDGLLYVEPFTRRSPVFEAGGYAWSFLFQPVVRVPGVGGVMGEEEEGVGIALRLETPGATVTVEIEISLVDPSGAHPVWSLTAPRTMDLVGHDVRRVGIGLTVPRRKLNYGAPGPGFLTRGGLLFQCTATVLAPAAAAQFPAVEEQVVAHVVSPPPPSESESDLTAQLARIRATGKGADVTFSVQGVRVPAHRIILAMRSPVFEAELFGGMSESMTTTSSKAIEVEGVDPDVFLALLDYIYTDVLPPPSAADGQDDDDDKLLRGLLVAADRYCVDRLKLLCEHRLRAALSVDNVAETLELAGDVGCSVLRHACEDFMSERPQQVKATQGYRRVRETCPMVLLDALERGPPVKKMCRRDDVCS